MTTRFDPNAIAVKNGNFLGLPYSPDEAEIVILPATWDATTSYRDGTREGPRAVYEASTQLDLFSPFYAEAWKLKIASLPTRKDHEDLAVAMRARASNVIRYLEDGGEIENAPASIKADLDAVNAASVEFHASMKVWTLDYLKKGKKVLTLGGDHSCALGSIQAHSEQLKEQSFSVLQLDAHADLRVAYEGFTHSHASIMYNILDISNLEKLVQVGIRDVSPGEVELSQTHPKIETFYDWDLQRARNQGKSWDALCQEIIRPLGQNVYISFDIDGLDPRFCPNTGTPVPGGLEFSQALHLFECILKSGRKIIGADLLEVSPGEGDGEWDANVGARMLYNLCLFVARSSKSH